LIFRQFIQTSLHWQTNFYYHSFVLMIKKIVGISTLNSFNANIVTIIKYTGKVCASSPPDQLYP
jgi:hypothetical protein